MKLTHDIKSFVLHLDSCYAQSHPAEDFAETFAVWLDPKTDWRKRYADWPALKKHFRKPLDLILST